MWTEDRQNRGTEAGEQEQEQEQESSGFKG